LRWPPSQRALPAPSVCAAQGELPDEATIKRLIRVGTIGGKFVPMTCGTAFKNKGVQPLLDAVVDYLPAPTDLPDVRGSAVDDAEQEMTRKSGDDAPFSGLAFKIMTDPFVGSLTFVRVYSGVLEVGLLVRPLSHVLSCLPGAGLGAFRGKAWAALRPQLAFNCCPAGVVKAADCA
jgi:hypothetical protein